MNSSYRRAVLPSAERSLREQAWQDAPTIAERFPRVNRVAIGMAFHDPRGAPQPSPMRQLYESSMRAFFQVRCPNRECSGGGFDLDSGIRSMLSSDRQPRVGHSRCRGSRGREGGECGLELTYSLTITDAADASPTA